MTRVLHERYGYTRRGLGAYLLNRVLRIYPPYWCAALLNAGLILWLGSDVTSRFQAVFFLPPSLTSVLRHVLVVFTVYPPPA